MAADEMFGTVMIGRSATSVEHMRSLVADWSSQMGSTAGFVDERALVTDDGRVVMCVRFVDRASYEALADNPAQAAWWEANLKPLLDGDPEWIDGHWHDI